MIQVYLSTNTNFDKNGDMALQPLSYEVSTAGINQAVEFTIEHEIDEYGRYEYLQKGNVIKAFTPWDLKNGQLFRIEDIDKDSKEGIIIASGYLLFYDNVKTYVKDFSNENVLICDTGNSTGEEAIKKIFKNTNYSGHSNIMKISRSRLERKNIVAALTGDDENSFVNRWGGELFIDNFDIYMNNKIGHDTGLVISYGRNMEYIKESSSYKNTVTRIIPIGFDGLRLTGKTPWVDSPNINKYPYIMEKEIKFDQVKVKEENSNDGFETIEEARAELIRLSTLLFEEDQIDSPEVSIEVSMHDLQGTLEYESYECYEEVNLGDYIKARHEILNIDTLVRCVGYTWDGIALKYKTIKLGHQIDNFFDKQTDIYNKVNNILNNDGSINAIEVAGILDAVNVTMKACRNIAQPLPVRVMICEDFDKDSPSYGAMCFGSMGFMIAAERTPDDKDWDWRTFGTGKGFFADLIVAGTMLADRIKSGMLMSMNEKTWIDMENGTFSFADGKLEWLNDILSINGNLKQINPNTNKTSCEIKDNSLIVYDHLEENSDSHEVGRLRAYRTQNKTDKRARNAIALNSRYDDLLIIGYLNEVGQLHEVMVFDSTGEYDGISNVSINGAVKTYRLYFQNNEDTFSGDVLGDGNMLRFRTSLNEGGKFVFGQAGTLTENIMEVSKDKLYHTGSIKCGNDMSCKNFIATGTKNRLVKTKDYGNIALNAYETAECYFGDIGEGKTDSNCETIVKLDDVFIQTVNTNEGYHVFLSKYDEGDIWVEERNKNAFKVKSNLPNIKFSYEIKAKQKDYENERLKEINLS